VDPEIERHPSIGRRRGFLQPFPRTLAPDSGYPNASPIQEVDVRPVLILGFLILAATHAAPRPAAADSDGYVREAVITGPVDLVWGLLTTDLGIRSWLAPQAEVDLRVGGLVRTHQDPKGKLGDPQTAVSRVMAVRPKKTFSFRLEQAPKGFYMANMIEGTSYDVALEALPGGKTRIRCEGNGLATGWASTMVRPVFNQGLDMVFDHLQQAVTRRQEELETRQPAAKPKRPSKS
jgi:uncharacterized protein YndB with AHSA1/START domain